jgi:hypothetical protein
VDLAPFKSWLVVVHVLGVLGFVMVHGVSALVLFRLRRERDPGRLRTMLDLSASTQGLMGIFLLVFFVSGVLAGLAFPNWWANGSLWLWASLGLFIVVMAAMTAFGASYLNEIRAALGMPTTRQRAPVAGAAVDEAALARLLVSSRPLVVAAIGIGGIAIIAWLMIQKPF